MREGGAQKDAVKAQRAKNREIRQQAIAAAAKPVASSTKHAQKKATGSQEAPLSLLSYGEGTEGEVLGDENDSWGKIVLWILTMPWTRRGGIVCLGVPERPPVLTRSGMAAKTSHI